MNLAGAVLVTGTPMLGMPAFRLFAIAHALVALVCAQPVTLQLDHVTVVDVVIGKRLHNRLVTVQGGRISSIVRSSQEANTERGKINAEGKYLVPGLWDMHFHSGSYANGKEPYPC